MGTASFRTRVKLGGPITPFTDEPVTLEGGVYQITDPFKRVWNPDTEIQGTKGGTAYDLVIEIDPAGTGTWEELELSDIESINMLFGMFRIDSGKDPTNADQVRVSGEYIPISEGEEYDPDIPLPEEEDTRIAFCNSYDLTLEAAILDKTGFREAQISDGSRVREAGLFDVNASLSGFGRISSQISDAFHDRESVLIEVIPGNGEEIFRGWFVVDTDSLSGDVEDLETGDLSFQGTTHYPTYRFPTAFGWSDVV